MNKPLIMVVEDDAAVRNLITTTLKLMNIVFRKQPREKLRF